MYSNCSFLWAQETLSPTLHRQCFTRQKIIRGNQLYPDTNYWTVCSGNPPLHSIHVPVRWARGYRKRGGSVILCRFDASFIYKNFNIRWNGKAWFGTNYLRLGNSTAEMKPPPHTHTHTHKDTLHICIICMTNNNSPHVMNIRRILLQRR